MELFLNEVAKDFVFISTFWKMLILSITKAQIGNGLIYTAGILWGIELCPQIKKTYSTKNVDSISLAFFSMCLVAYSLYTIGNYLLGNTHIIIAHIPSLVLNLWMVLLIIKYKGNKK